MKQFNDFKIENKSFTPYHFPKKELQKLSPIKSGASFTLIEILVSVLIFSIIFGAISGVLVSSIREQRRILTYQTLLDQTSYTLEYMGRALRMARKQLSPDVECPTTCLTQGLNYELFNDQEVRFQNSDCVCQRFFLQNGQLMEQKGWEGEPSCDQSNPLIPSCLPLTSSNNLQIDFLKFNISGQDQADSLQPRITFYLVIEGKGAFLGNQPTIKIQSTISQRMLDVEY